MNMFVVMLLLWIICAPLSYVLMREDHIATSPGSSKWTRTDRIVFGTIALLYGPCMLIVIGLINLLNKVSESEWGKQEASW